MENLKTAKQRKTRQNLFEKKQKEKVKSTETELRRKYTMLKIQPSNSNSKPTALTFVLDSRHTVT